MKKNIDLFNKLVIFDLATNHVGDSYYDNNFITSNKNRKTKIIFRADWLDNDLV